MIETASKELLRRAAADPVEFGRVFLGWQAFPAQAEWLRKSLKSQNWCRAGNRWGKTESIAIKHLWNCTFKHRDPKAYVFATPYETVNTCLSLDQATIPLQKAWRLVHRPRAALYREAFIRRMVNTPFPKIEFSHGSTWWARSTVRKGKYLEGKDFDYCSNDEGAFDPDLDYIIDEVLSLRLLDRGGTLDCISTGRRGSAFNRRFEAAKGDPDQFAVQGRTIDNPHVNQTALARIMEKLPEALIEERIYGGERPSDGRIPLPSIMRALQLGTGFAPASRGRRYSSGWDLARLRDHTVGMTLDITEQPYQLVAWEMFNQDTVNIRSDKSYWEHVYERIRRRHQMYGGLCQIDATGLGDVVADRLYDMGAEAIVFTGGKLEKLIGCLELAFGVGAVGMPHLEMERADGRTWTFTDELEEVSDELSGLDSATALALALWGVRAELQGDITRSLAPRVAGARW